MRIGDAQFDPASGDLLKLGDLPIDPVQVDVWRAPIDNDRPFSREPNEVGWRALGLERMRHRVDRIEYDDDLTVHARVAPAASRLGLRVIYRWQGDALGLRLTVEVLPEGDWTVPLPRLGVRLGVPGRLRLVEWYGGGPGRRIRTAGRPPGSDATPRPWTTCRRHTCTRRRTGIGPRSAG